MAVIDIKEVSRLNGTQILHSKANFDTVETIKRRKPEMGVSGILNNRDSDESAKLDLDNPSLAESPNFYKHNGYVVENLGYFTIPRSVTSDPRYRGCRTKYQKVLWILFENVAFSPTTHAIGTNIINIEIGQFCVSVRGLADLCNEGVKFKEDLIDKNTVERASHFFQKCGFVRQEVRHGKIVITITVPEFYERLKKKSETESETKPRQNRDTKEKDKEYKEDNNIFPKKGSFEPSSLATSLLADFYSSLFSSIPDFPKEKAKKTKTQYEAAERLLKNHTPESLKQIIAYAHTPGGFWIKHVHSITYLEKKIVTLKEQIKNPFNGKKPPQESLHNKSFTKDTRPSQQKNRFDFSKEIPPQ